MEASATPVLKADSTTVTLASEAARAARVQRGGGGSTLCQVSRQQTAQPVLASGWWRVSHPTTMSLLAAVTLLATAAAAAGATPGRTVIPFQYAWRFHYGDDPSSPPESGPGTAVWVDDLANYSLCEGIEHAPNRFSLKDCRLACAYDPHCMVWQAYPIAHGRSCYQVRQNSLRPVHQPRATHREQDNPAFAPS